MADAAARRGADPQRKARGAAGRRHHENLDGALPRDAFFRDSDGKPVHLGDYFDGKRPTLLVFAYHTCPMLCSLVLDATVKALDNVAWTVGDQFHVVSISIDPKDTPDTAAKKRAQVVDGYRRARGDPKGWHFLIGGESQIRKVTDAVGFEYRYDARQKQYAHPAAIYVLTPEGHIARYLYGIQYDPNIRLGLLEASGGALDFHDRANHPVLLPLRSQGRALLARRGQRDAGWRWCDLGRARRPSRRHVGSRAAQATQACAGSTFHVAFSRFTEVARVS
jgi:cytochrome oxidase Cu insertion factor (SCO1/SenC/PrrC family)